MIKIIDVDALFDKYISDYVYASLGKVKPEEIENKIPALYVEFGNTMLKDLDGKTPNMYYRSFTGNELVECLINHLNQKVAVSDFLCEAITENKENEGALVEQLRKDNDEELTLYLMNMLSEMKSEKVSSRYLEFILWDYPESVRELATESLSEHAEEVKEQILTQYNDVNEQKKACLLDVLSNCKNDDRVFNILINEFLKDANQIPLHAAYLGKYGDERALPYLMTAIENEKLSYADFEELRFAIESLGGQYDKVRDFSSDKTYKKIKGIKRK